MEKKKLNSMIALWTLLVGSSVILAFGWVAISLSGVDRFLDWFDAEGGTVVKWWLLVTLAGLGVFPLLYRLLPNLADRGYALSRVAGLMLTGFVFWFLASIGFLQNDPSAMVFAWVLVLGVSLVAWLQWPKHPTLTDVRRWLGEHYPLILLTELLFIVAFVGWAFIRAHNPELTSTEKPMEMAFINGVRNSATFPPKDPWLAGYAISYYYFGYVLAASLADLSNVSTPMAFNMVNALLFALTVTGGLGVGYNLVRSQAPLQRWRVGQVNAGVGVGLLAALFIAIMGNLGTVFIQMPYKGYGSDTSIVRSVVNADYFMFWDVRGFNGPFYIEEIQDDDSLRYRLLDTNELLPVGVAPPEGYVRPPDRDLDGVFDWDDTSQRLTEGNMNWWQYSRVIRDRNLSGDHIEVIAEFPNFSFLLADNHPHVLALPFTLLMLGLAMNLAFGTRALEHWQIALYGVFIGGMIFMNAWDAVYLVVIVAAEALRRLMRNGTGGLSGWDEFVQVITGQYRSENNPVLAVPTFLGVLLFILFSGVAAPEGMYWLLRLLIQVVLAIFLTVPITLIVNWMLDDNDWAGVVRLGAAFGILTYILYQPWFAGFYSQANGFFPNIINPSRSQQLFLQFGIFVFLIAPFLVVEALKAGRRIRWGTVSAIVVIGILLLLLVPVLSMAFVNWQCPAVGEKTGQIERFAEWSCLARNELLGVGFDSESTLTLIGDVLKRRMEAIVSQGLLLLVIGVIATRLFAKAPYFRKHIENDSESLIVDYSPNTGIALLLIGAAVMAILIPDLVFLRDNFNWRMNTVFKLYYQAWVMLSVGSAYAIYASLRGRERLVTETPRQIINLPIIGLQALYGIGAIMVILAGMAYPYYANYQHYLIDSGRTEARRCVASGEEFCFEERPITLDGTDSLTRSGNNWIITQDELAVMKCFAEAVPPKNDAVLVEAAGGAYSPELGRFSMFTGIPTLLGWDNHERQWRGDGYVDVFQAHLRPPDVDRLYQLSADQWPEAQKIIDKYGIDYVVVGVAERTTYQNFLSELNKFDELFDPICQQGDVAVYRVSS